MRAALYRSKDFAQRFEHGGCRVSVVRCTSSLQESLDGWGWHIGSEEKRVVENVLGPLFVCTVMHNSFLKGEERTQGILSLDTGSVAVVEANRRGEVRARFIPDMMPGLQECLQDNQAIFLDVKKVLYGKSRPFISSVRLDGKEKFGMSFGEAKLFPGVIESLWNHFYLQSEQIPSTAFSKTVVGNDGRVKLCAGVTIQGLVSSDDEVFPEHAVEKLRFNMCQKNTTLPPLNMLEEMNGAEWWNTLMQENVIEISERAEKQDSNVDVYRVDKFCPCSAERFAKTLVNTVGPEELESYYSMEGAEKDSFPVNCEFCNQQHMITREVVEKVHSNAR